MSLPDAVLDALLASGATADMIVAAVKASNAGEEARLAEKREKDRLRQQRHRASRDVTVTERDMCDTPSPSPFLPPDPQLTPIHTPGNNTPARKGTRLAEDWEPDGLSGSTAEMVLRWPPGALDREREKFRNYWLAKPGKDAAKTNWQRTWINWLLSADERIGRNGNDRQSSFRKAQPVDGFAAALRQAANS